MAEESQASSTEQTTSTEEQTQTLDDVYKHYNVEEQSQGFNPQRQTQQATQNQPAQQQQPQVPAIPDPVLDPQGYKQWHGQQNSLVHNALSQIVGELKSFKDERTKSREEADIKGAVAQFRKVVGDEVDEEMAEVALGARARKDPKFMTVYNNRNANPQAWSAAVSAYANEFKGKLQFKIDPQLTENVRAAKQSVQGSQTNKPAGPSGDDARFAGKTGAAFTQEWSRYVGGGQY